MKQHSGRWAAIKFKWDRFMQVYTNFMEKQGFYLVLGICVMVIVGTAVWTQAARTPNSPPRQEEGQSVDMPYEGVQQLADVTVPVASKTPAVPTVPPAPAFSRPLKGNLIRAFDRSHPVFFAAANLWQVHSACDYQTATGDVVSAIGDGTVIEVSQSGAYGKTVTISHSGGYVSICGGLSMNSYVKVGDPIREGQAIGHVGNTTLYETEDGSHLHLAVYLYGQPIDPETLFSDNN